MGSVQRDLSCLFTFVLGLSTLVIGTNALAQMTYPDRLGPDKGGFDWTQFQGRYDSSECQSRPSPIWGNSTPGTFVQIDHKVAYTHNSTSEGLEVMVANDGNPIALGRSV